MTTTLFPVILAGGAGTRLWPLSRKNFPKQFLCLNGKSSLLQQTVERVQQLHAPTSFVICNEAHYFLCQQQLTANILYLLEPCSRNTAPALAVCAHYLVAQAKSDAVMVILPADHWIDDNNAWALAISKAAQYALTHQAIVTFGIKPQAAQTGYGYIESGEETAEGFYAIKQFHEKPDSITAEHYLTNNAYYWNSGMFVCTAKTYIDELAKYRPDILKQSLNALKQAHQAHDFFRLDEVAFSQIASESIDYAIMEKTQQAVVMPVDFQWSDLGCWKAVADAQPLDENGNALQGQVIVKDSSDCLINSDHMLVTTLGIHHQIIVATKDAVLVADKQYSQQVKELVEALKQTTHHELTDEHQRVNRPWGFYEVLAQGETFKVKRLMVKAGAKLSLQSHQHRAEHWVVVSGVADIVNGDSAIQLQVNQSTYIPQKARHRLSNPGPEPLFVIEVQSGPYLGEDDITRFDDVYQRPITTKSA